MTVRCMMLRKPLSTYVQLFNANPVEVIPPHAKPPRGSSDISYEVEKTSMFIVFSEQCTQLLSHYVLVLYWTSLH